MTKTKELTIDELAQQVKTLTEKVEALESEKASKKKKTETPRQPSKYAMFIKEKYPEVKQQNPTAKMGEISKIIAQMWKEKES